MIDASNLPGPAVLNQRVRGKLASVSYYNRLLFVAERKCITYKRERLGFLFWCENCRTYSEHKEFEVHCDILALCCLFEKVKDVGGLAGDPASCSF